MKHTSIIVFFLSAILATNSLAQNSAYELQRKKINGLLENRSAKFGQYDESLTMRTGIFGLKTKKDMQRSIDILTEIVKTDNAIFKELKVLLDYKDLEKSQVESKAEESTSRMNSYMLTIRKLQQQNENLKKEAETIENEKQKAINILIASILVIIAVLIILFATKKLTFL